MAGGPAGGGEVCQYPLIYTTSGKYLKYMLYYEEDFQAFDCVQAVSSSEVMLVLGLYVGLLPSSVIYDALLCFDHRYDISLGRISSESNAASKKLLH